MTHEQVFQRGRCAFQLQDLELAKMLDYPTEFLRIYLEAMRPPLDVNTVNSLHILQTLTGRSGFHKHPRSGQMTQLMKGACFDDFTCQKPEFKICQNAW